MKPHTKLRWSAVTLAIVLTSGLSGAIGQTPTPSAPGEKPSPTAAPTPPKPRTAEDAVTPAMVKLNRHEGIMARKSKGEIGLLFLGDSISRLTYPPNSRSISMWARPT